MQNIKDEYLRKQLTARRHNLEQALSRDERNEQILRLLKDVDEALEKMEEGIFGLCTVCHEPIEEDRLIADPLVCICLDHLSSSQQKDLEDDLHLAARIQKKLLPKRSFSANGWEIYCRYEAAGIVSGDYLDIVKPETGDGTLYILVGDVSGKGIAASMLMAHLYAIIRTLISAGTHICKLASQANRIFCESTISTHYATLVIAKVNTSGKVEICNAGHNPPILLKKGSTARLEATGLPLGMFCDAEYKVTEEKLDEGNTILFYTDGVTETTDDAGVEFGEERLIKSITETSGRPIEVLVNSCLDDISTYRADEKKSDDLTILGLRRT